MKLIDRIIEYLGRVEGMANANERYKLAIQLEAVVPETLKNTVDIEWALQLYRTANEVYPYMLDEEFDDTLLDIFRLSIALEFNADQMDDLIRFTSLYSTKPLLKWVQDAIWTVHNNMMDLHLIDCANCAALHKLETLDDPGWEAYRSREDDCIGAV